MMDKIKKFLRRVVLHLISDQIHKVGRMEQRIESLESKLKVKPHLSKKWDVFPTRVKEEFDYFDFEEVFHDEEVVKGRQKVYLDLFKGRKNILDVGCGRGEFLNILQSNGIPATGIDLNAKMIACCESKGLKNVVLSDFEGYLKGLPDDSLGGVFSSQFIEHLELDPLNRFFKLSYQKIAPNGLLVVETVNPHCLPAFKLFYLDPTHVRPLFPEFVYFLCKSSGFRNIKTLYLTGNGFSEILYDEYGDYALVAEK